VQELFAQLQTPADKTAPRLHQRKRSLGVAIYSDYPALKERLEALGLSCGPQVRLYGPENFGAQKPAPRPFKCIARDLGVLPEDTLVIGDRVDTDGFGAIQAGMRFFLLDDGLSRYFLLDPDRIPPEKEVPSVLLEDILPRRGSWNTIYTMLSEYITGQG
jgi:FMN phosphatase YigB (HAD superfamily)